MPIRRPCIASLLVAGVSLTTQAAGAWTLDDMLEVATMTHAIPAPDGKQVAYVVSRADLQAQPSRFQQRLFVASDDGREQRPFTFGTTVVKAPRWSPDGAWLAYLENAPGKAANVVLISADGGNARRLTDFAAGAVDLRWSPRGTGIAVLRPDARASDDAALVDAVPAGAPEPRHHLWLVPLAGDGTAGEPRRLTGGDFHVGHRLLDGAFDWSPDGRRIAFTRTASPALEAWQSADIAIVDVASGSIHDFQQSDAAEFAPRYAPNGSRIAFSITVYPPSWIRQSRIGLARADGSRLQLLAATPDEQPRIVGWLSNRLLLVEEPARTVTGLWTLPVNGDPPQRFDDGSAVLGAVALNAPGTRLAFTTSSASAPPEVALTGLRRFRPVAVSAANADLPVVPAAAVRSVTWRAADGREIEGLLTLPPGHRAGQRHPLLVLVHGGPALAHQDRFLGTADPLEPLAALAARGYATLRPNPRGSSGYGHAFRAANRGDWGGGDYQDVMAGIDHLVELGLADPQRLAIAGWSYGGYLAAWAVTRGHRFAAAIAGAPVTDLAQLSVTTDVPGLVPDYLGGTYWERPELYRERSPLLAADRVTTPLLVLHGAADPRIPPDQGRALYQALRQRGVTARLVSYPRAPHLLEEPRQIRHAAGETLAWLDRHMPVQ